jgi:hypothetical protein
VTCKTWHDIWLNEGFARYGEALWAERRPGGSHAAYLSVLNGSKPSPAGTGTVYRYDISSTGAIFSTEYVYNKGGWILHMLRHVLGDEKFFETLATYREAFGGAAADTEDFKAVVESVSGRNMTWFFDQWVYGFGAPYYRYQWQQETFGTQNYLRLYVQQYQNTLPTPLPIMTMPIDVRVQTPSGSETLSVINNAAEQWFVLPVGHGVTSVTLDPDTWILRGAASTTTYVTGPPKLLWTTPAPNSTTNGMLSQIELQFSQGISWVPSDFEVEGSVTGPAAFTVQPDISGSRVTLKLTPPMPANQTCTVIVHDTLTSTAGMFVPLDGELIDGTFPSGDGLPGGDAQFSFVLPLSAPGDFDGDGDADYLDLIQLLACYSGANIPPAPGCGLTDLDRDGDVDQSDFGIFQRCTQGENQPTVPNCAPGW